MKAHIDSNIVLDVVDGEQEDVIGLLALEADALDLLRRRVIEQCGRPSHHDLIRCREIHACAGRLKFGSL